MKNLVRHSGVLLIGATLMLGGAMAQPGVPLAEHPRPDFERADWINLNGPWQFRFDGEDAGERGEWFKPGAAFPETIVVPFPWGSALSKVESKADIGWYGRSVRIPEAWQGKRVFVVVGACDWQTTAWLDGKPLGTHKGGYTPFEFELTKHARWGQDQRLVLRVDDRPHPFKLEGKQGYGPAKGIWQTVYIEARAPLFIQNLHFVPDIDKSQVTVKATFSEQAASGVKFALRSKAGAERPLETLQSVSAGVRELTFDLPISEPRLWSLEDPYLYEVQATLESGDGKADRVASYFGMRKISVVPLPGTDFPYIALNGKPVYLCMTLDQSYHPEGFYTYPSDEFMRDEILRSRRIGLNANRLHVKIDVPRKLYWADRLGLLLMCDVPNSWGEPTAEMRHEIEYALRGMIQRDFNHPAIFSWVPFNETWGLFSRQGDKRQYLPETQEWVAEVYRLAKSLDPTRLVEDNSPCNNDHVVTDINSWHAYLPGYEWKEHLDQVCRDTKPGSKWNFIGGRVQASQPLLNSECGNVWGYEGSTGDVDWSWDYHIMMNEFRRHPKVCGWLYTEHHDVINEWNGYYRYDRSDKFTGLEEIVPGMTLRDLHSPCYLAVGTSPCQEVGAGESVLVPLWASILSDSPADTSFIAEWELYGWDILGRKERYADGRVRFSVKLWESREIEAIKVTMPRKNALAVLSVTLRNEPAGVIRHRNFTTFVVGKWPSPREGEEQINGARFWRVAFAPSTFSAAKWSRKHWGVLDGLKVNGAGCGYFEYRIPWPKDARVEDSTGGLFLMEASAKQLFGKDREGAGKQEGDFMRGKGTLDSSLNPNAYPMTDTIRFPSSVRVRVNGVAAGVFELPDDPADHQGILSWHSQKRDRHLREAGSYGYLVAASIPPQAIRTAAAAKEFVIRLEVDDALPGGLAIYGEKFGRYPLDPTLLIGPR